jgi:hypothetical protein
MQVLQSVDRSVLLLMKTNDCLRTAAVRLGARATETYIITAEVCIRALRNAGLARVQRLGGGGGGPSSGPGSSVHGLPASARQAETTSPPTYSTFAWVAALQWRWALWRASLRISLFRCVCALQEWRRGHSGLRAWQQM